MKKIIFSFLSLAFLIFPLFAFCEVPEESYSAHVIIIVIYATAWLIVISLTLSLVIIATRKIIRFFKKDKGIPPAGNVPSWKNITLKLILPLAGILGYFAFLNSLSIALHDSFSYHYGDIAFNLIAIIFFIGSLFLASSMKKKGKEWEFFYTLIVLVLFLIAFLGAIAIGEHYYVPDPDREIYYSPVPL